MSSTERTVEVGGSNPVAAPKRWRFAVLEDAFVVQGRSIGHPTHDAVLAQLRPQLTERGIPPANTVEICDSPILTVAASLGRTEQDRGLGVPTFTYQ